MSEDVDESALGDLRVQWRTVHGYRRAFRKAGTGPRLLFVHGIGDSSRTWLHVLPLLRERFTVIAPDLLGHGDSDKPRADYSVAAYACGLRDLLSVLDVDTVTIVGHSLGGGVAMQFAYQFPERCERLVLVATGGVGHTVHSLLRWSTAPGAELLLPLVTSSPTRFLMRQLDPLLRKIGGLGIGPDTHYALERYQSLGDNTAREAFMRTLRSVVDKRGQAVTMLDRCYVAEQIPTLLIWGDQDRVIPSAHAETAHSAMPGSTLTIFAGAGHFPHQADPNRFAELLTQFHTETNPHQFDPQQWRAVLRAGNPATVSSGT